LVFVGSGTAAAAALRFRTTPAVGVLLVALGLGLALFAGIIIAGKVSGGHYNPAVTVGLAAAGRFAWEDVPGYLVGQVVGAVVGALGILVIYSQVGLALRAWGHPRWRPTSTSGRAWPARASAPPSWCWRSWAPR
jgi:glycerol uptake facilitator-like aquaporin